MEVWKQGCYLCEMRRVTKAGLKVILAAPFYLDLPIPTHSWHRYYSVRPLAFTGQNMCANTNNRVKRLMCCALLWFALYRHLCLKCVIAGYFIYLSLCNRIYTCTHIMIYCKTIFSVKMYNWQYLLFFIFDNNNTKVILVY